VEVTVYVAVTFCAVTPDIIASPGIAVIVFDAAGLKV
jgi:hypothetical protein